LLQYRSFSEKARSTVSIGQKTNHSNHQNTNRTFALGIIAYKQGWKICYSTCSILKDENSELVQSFLCENKGFVLEKENLTLPNVGKCAGDFDCDGGYCAIIGKK
jgi:hypothetical protein